MTCINTTLMAWRGLQQKLIFFCYVKECHPGEIGRKERKERIKKWAHCFGKRGECESGRQADTQEKWRKTAERKIDLPGIRVFLFFLFVCKPPQ